MSASVVPPFVIRRDGTVLDRESRVEVGHVHLNDYGWHASTEWGEHRMHTSQREAASAAWREWRTRSVPSNNGMRIAWNPDVGLGGDQG